VRDRFISEEKRGNGRAEILLFFDPIFARGDKEIEKKRGQVEYKRTSAEENRAKRGEVFFDRWRTTTEG